MVWTTSVEIDGETVKMQLLEGEEVADKIFTSLSSYAITRKDRQKIMDVAKADGVSFTREHAHVISEAVVINSTGIDKSTRMLNIYDNGVEPVDVIYRFAKKKWD